MDVLERNLIALFPALFSRRRKAEQATLWHRDWINLQVPHLVVMGPNWTVTANLRQLNDHPRRHALAVLADAERPEELASLPDRLHRPVLLKAGIESLWGVAKGDAGLVASRLSALAVDLVNKHLKAPEPLARENAASPIEAGLTTQLIVAPFGEMPANILGTLYLPASRLVHGQIWCQPTLSYLRGLRETLALGAPVGLDHADLVALLPDGFAVAGSLKLPWLNQPLSAWFRVTTARDGTVDMDALSVWTERDAGSGWDGAMAELRAILDGAAMSANSAKWLNFRPVSTLGIQDLAWPCKVANHVLLRRAQEDPVRLLGRSVQAQMGDRRQAEGTVLTLRPDGFDVRGTPRRLEIAATARPAADNGGEPAEKTDALYDYSRRTGENAVEVLRIGRGRVGGQVMHLAVPMLSNAARLRDAMGFPEPQPDNQNAPAKEWTWTRSNRLWLFSPVARGWLHWAFPNATIRTLGLTGTIVPEPSARSLASFGLWDLSGPDNMPARSWQIDLSGVEEAELSLKLELQPSGGWELTTATVKLSRLSAGFRGLMPVTAFAQTLERILPDAAERALRGMSLDAVTPDLLEGTERAAWNGSADGGLRVTATVRDLVLRPIADGAGPGAEADGALDLTVQWPAAGKPHAATFGIDQSETRPWLWLRHPRLPTAQTMPLATAGDESRRPSSLRELAPLRPAAERREIVTLTLPRAFAMGASFVEIDEAGLGKVERPTAGEGWIDEVGMATTTLPTLTLFPGVPEGAGLTLTTVGWGPINVTTNAELRHDIALTDEGCATAQLPPPPEGDPVGGAARPEGATFEILAYNAPGDEVTGAAPWRRVWAERNRSLALAATEDRRLVDRPATPQNGIEHVLSGLFHGVELPLAATGIRIDETLVFANADATSDFYEPGTSRRHLVRAGAIALIPDAAHGPVQDLAGLPATGDLTGVSGAFHRGPRKAELRRGALVERRSEGEEGAAPRELLDQGGWQVVPGDGTDGGPVRRRRIRHVTAPLASGAPAERIAEYDLVTLAGPMDLNMPAGPAARFHFRDVPMEVRNGQPPTADLAAAWYDTDTPDGPARGLDTAAAGMTVARNHLHGFAWSLDQGRSDGHLALGPFLFQPLALLAVTLGADGAALAQATIVGRVLLPAGSPRAAPIAGAGQATLTLVPDEDQPGRLQWTFDVRSLTLPLVDPARDDEDDWHAPVLSAAELRLDAAGNLTATDARLEFRLGDRLIRRGVRAVGNGALYRFVDTGAAVDAKADLHLSEANVILAAAAADEDENPAEPVRITALLGGRIGEKEAFLEIAQTIAIVGVDPDPAQAGSIFHLGTTRIPAALDIRGIDDQSVAIDWKLREGDDAALMGALKITEAAGAALAVLGRPSGDSGFRSVSEHVAMRTVAAHGDLKADPRAAALSLSYDTARDRRHVLAQGTVVAGNLFSWPGLDVVEVSGIGHVGRSAGGAFRHALRLEIEAAAIPITDLEAGHARLAARALHTIVDPDGATLCQWQANQSVVLTSAEQMARELRARADSRDLGVLAGAVTDGRRHVAPVRRLMISGLSVRQADALAEALDAAPGTMVVDASAHHLLPLVRGPGDTDAAPLAHLPLPVLAAIGAAAQDVLTPEPLPEDYRLQRPLDQSYRNGIAPLGAAALRRLADRLAAAVAEARRRQTDPATVLAGDAPLPDTVTQGDATDRRHRTLFQGLTAYSDRDGDPDTDHPWAEIAMCLALFRDAGATQARHGFTLRQSGWTGGELLHRELVAGASKATVTTKASHRLSWSPRFLDDEARHLVPGPEPRGDKAPSRPRSQIALFATRLDGIALREIARRDVAAPGDRTARALEEWAKGTMARQAPWSRAGLLNEYTLLDGVARLAWSRAITATDLLQAVRRPRLAGRSITGPGQPQGQRQPGPPQATMPEGLARGYLPERVDAETLTSEPGPLPAAGQTAVRLTASAAAVGVTLASSGRRLLEDAGEDALQFWTSDRETVSFRPYQPVAEHPAQTRVTFALPPGTQAALPAALLPGRKVAAQAEKSPGRGYRKVAAQSEPSTERGYLPPAQFVSLVGARTGVMTARRIGIDAAAPDAAAAHSAQELPVWQRTPRPVELGVNDRPRASLYEDAHAALGAHPTAMLHGPARQGPLETREGGLDRSPKSTDALLLAVKDGLLPPGWGGGIRLEVAGVFHPPGSGVDTPRPPPRWAIDHALLTIDGRIYQGTADDPMIGGNDERPRTLSGFRLDDTRAEDVFAALPAAGEIVLTLILSRTDPPAGLTRRLLFRLRKGGAGALVDVPAHIRFEDPAYNDRLTGQPLFDAMEPANSNQRLALLGELKEVRPDDYFETLLAIQNLPQSGSASFLAQDGADLTLVGDKPNKPPLKVRFQLERRRPGERDPVRLTIQPQVSAVVTGATWIQVPILLPLCAPEPGQAVAAGPLLRPGDLLTLLAIVGDTTTGEQAIRLNMAIVNHPILPANPAAYGLLRLADPQAAPEGTLSLPLYQRGAEPTWVELVDPAEMSTGLIRRRAHFAWSTFVAGPAPGDRFALQKSSGIGASWLPDDVERDWLLLPSKRKPD
jgi:hypothetical protein